MTGVDARIDRQVSPTKWRYAAVLVACAVLLAAGVANYLGNEVMTQSGWTCFKEAHDPMKEQGMFVACIVAKTEWDMKRNPQLYGPLATKPDEIGFEFLGAERDEGKAGWVNFRFRYPTKAGPYCRYYFPDEFGRYHLQGAYPEKAQPNGRC